MRLFTIYATNDKNFIIQVKLDLDRFCHFFRLTCEEYSQLDLVWREER